VTRFVIDASVAIKWVVEEDGTPHALAVRRQARLISPELASPNAPTSSGRKCVAMN
jgi:predicted nucleic acid-binding protein